MYEDIFKQYDKSVAGQRIISTRTVEIGTDAPTLLPSGKYGTVTISLNTNIQATMTGRYVTFSNGTRGYQIIYNNNEYGYVFSDTLNQWSKIESGKSTVAAQNTLSEIFEYHKSILEKNLLCARGLELLAESGAAVPVEYKQGVFDLQRNLIGRNNTLKQSGYIEDIQEAEHPTLNKYNQALVNFMNNPGVGFVISTTAVIIILAVVSALSVTVAYTVFKKMNTQAKADFKFSNSLTADLIKYLPAPVYEQLMKENAANQAAAQDAIDKAKGGGIFTAVKTGGLILLGVWVADKFIFNNRSNN